MKSEAFVTVTRELLRQALAQLEINRTNFYKGPSKSMCKCLAGGNDDAITALRAALEQPGVEPVASVTVSHYKGFENRDLDYWGELPDGTHMLYAAPQPAQQKMCHCEERPASECPGEWEPGCDLGNNPKYVGVPNETS